ncbi:signal peptidase I [Cellulomonas oligotrophica]|uniref:Signal peptidase I n=1 Tax=Cellulomonas oligotrophica TaxID=931536 RepID=A0A7Y9FIQ4_9CELL|nr:signal peptidase I [Cellulomonas oligotrophica]
MSERRPDDLRTTPAAWQHETRATPWQPTSAQEPRFGATASTPGPDAPAGARRVPVPQVPRRRERASVHRRRWSAWSWVRETAIILVSALVLSLVVKSFLVQAFFIPSQSMHETLVENDRILVSKLTPGPFDLRRGDIVVFKDPGGWLQPEPVVERGPVVDTLTEVGTFIGLLPQDAGEHLVKRIIGLPGDHVACAGPGEPVTVNGVALDETAYLAPGSVPSERAFDVVVPENSLWVMGDNRQHSSDSRYNQGRPGGGSVPVDNVVGMAFVTVWPLDRTTVLRNPTETFANVPDPA